MCPNVERGNSNVSRSERNSNYTRVCVTHVFPMSTHSYISSPELLVYNVIKIENSYWQNSRIYQNWRYHLWDIGLEGRITLRRISKTWRYRLIKLGEDRFQFVSTATNFQSFINPTGKHRLCTMKLVVLIIIFLHFLTLLSYVNEVRCGVELRA